MNILLWSWSFHPSVGGIETMTEILGKAFTARGHNVTVITRTGASPLASADFPFTVVRRPSWRQLTRLVADCDVFVHNHLSLKVALPLLFFRRLWLVVYQTWYPPSGVRGCLRFLVSRFALNVACSRAVAEYTHCRCQVIPNAYDDTIFRKVPQSARERELVFVGRLITDKGMHVLLEALALLRAEGIRPRLTVVGEGPQMDHLVTKSRDLALMDQVEFIGARSGETLAAILNCHQILVVPSLWQEPFGIVALEAIACGCIVVGSEGGGLKEAIGPCGVTFPNGDAPALAKALSRLLVSPEIWPQYRQGAQDHLHKHTPAAVATAYLEAIQQVRTRVSARAGVSTVFTPGTAKTVDVASPRREIPMKILLWSYSFHPNIGGIETMTEILGREFTTMGHEVTVITRTVESPPASADFPFTVVRKPSWYQLIRLVGACDVFVHNHLSLKVAFPLLFFRRPWVVVYHCFYPNYGIRGRLQPLVSRFALNVACSEVVAEYMGPDCLVIPNGYDDRTFRKAQRPACERELVFVGRLITDKGVQLLLEALTLLRDERLRPRLTVVGEGPDWDHLIGKARDLGLTDQVEFIGKRSGLELAAILNYHRILVVPSLVQESFGIVALEAIACGCIVVGSEVGGLKQAIGPCGLTFPNGDAPALAKTLSSLLRSPETWRQYHQYAADHLRKHASATVASAYLDVIKRVVSSGLRRSQNHRNQRRPGIRF
jgi:glycogen(starch) synthase